jgi:hypothetical protein
VVLPLPPLLPPPWPPLPGVNGRSDLQALSAARPAEVDCSSLNTLLNPPPEADGLGRVTPCADRQLSKLPNAALNPPPDPPNPPDGRSEAQACRALLFVLLLELPPLELPPLDVPPLEVPPLEVPPPEVPPPNPVTPCSRRQLT